MAGKDLIELGFDYAATNAEKEIVVKALQEVLDLAQKLDGFKIKINFVEGFGDFKSAADAAGTTIEELIKQMTKLAELQLKQAQAARAAAQAETENTKAKLESIKAQIEEEKLKASQLKNAEALKKAYTNEKKLVDELSNDYAQLSKAYNDAALKAKILILTKGEDNEVTKEAIRVAKQMGDLLKKVDAAVGQYQRNVGNYKSAFDGLKMSFTQVARELPSLTISVQQFFLAISNNLPIVFDEIAKTRKQIADLQAEGKEAPSLLSKIGQAIISWQVGLSIGITLLTAYGAKFIEWLTLLATGRKSLEDITIDMNHFTWETKENAKALDQVISRMEQLSELSKLKIDLNLGTGLTQDFLKQVSDATALTGKRLELEGQLQTEQVRLANLVNYALRQFSDDDKKIWNTYQDNIDDAYFKLSDSGKKIVDAYKNQKERIDKINGDLNQVRSQEAILAEQTAIKLKQIDIEEIQDDLDSKKIRLLNDEKFQQSLADSESLGLQMRLKAQREATADRIALFQVERDRQLAADNLTTQQRANIEKEAAQNIYNERLAGYTALAKLRTDFYTKELQERRAIENKLEDEDRQRGEVEKQIANSRYQRIQEEVNIIKSGADDMATIYSTQYVNEQTALIESYNKRKISAVQFQEEMAQLQIKYSQENLQRLITTSEKTLQLLSPGTKAWVDLKKAIADAKNQLAQLGTKHPELDALAEKLSRIAAITQNLTGALSSINDIGYSNQKAELQALEDQQQANYEKEVENINNSSLSEEDKANKLKILESQRAAQKEQNDRRQREADNKKAKFDRDINIANIIAGTAAAVVKALPNIPLALSIGILGAAQLAKALAVKVPQYAEGVEDKAFDGPGIVGEGKYAELVERPGYRPFIATDAMMIDLPKHSRVTPLTGDVINDSMHAAMVRNTGRQLQLMDAYNSTYADQAWKIAGWQMNSMEKMFRKSNKNVLLRGTINIGLDGHHYKTKTIFQ